MSPHLCYTTAAGLLVLLAQVAAAAPVRIAVIGGGIGGTAAAYRLRQLQPSWHIELFERERIGGRTDELLLDGRTLELGASIVHAQNHYVLSLAKQLGLTPVQGDDTGDAFSIYDGSSFVFSQGGSQLQDTFAVLRRYGISPLRYKWLAEEMGKRFGRIYKLQQAGQVYDTPQQLLEALDLFNVTQQSAADYMQAHLSRGLLHYGFAAFIEELAGAVNRINYNQRNRGMNALAGLVSYLPAAQPEVYSIKEGNAALPRKLAAAAKLQALRLGTAVQAVQLDASGQYTLQAVQTTPSTAANKVAGEQSLQPLADEAYGPYDAVVIATPLEGSGIKLQGVLPPSAALPLRKYQSTVTSYVTGALNPSYFKVKALPAGDIFVIDSAATPFSVIASKGAVPDVSSSSSSSSSSGLDGCQAAEGQQQQQQPQATQQHSAGEPQQAGMQQQQLWKVFSQEPMSTLLLQEVFINGTVIVSKAWKAYPQFHPPEAFAPFTLSPGLCYGNALENGASAMEVSAVAAMNCALLLQQHLVERAAGSSGSSSSSSSSSSAHAASLPAVLGAVTSSAGVAAS